MIQTYNKEIEFGTIHEKQSYYIVGKSIKKNVFLAVVYLGLLLPIKCSLQI